jgi:hypothetical protein
LIASAASSSDARISGRRDARSPTGPMPPIVTVAEVLMA